MGALQYSDVPGYDALLLRPTLSELQLAGGLIELAQEWLAGSRASWSGSAAHHLLSARGSGTMTIHVPRGRIPARTAIAHPERAYSHSSPEELAAFLGATYFPSRPR